MENNTLLCSPCSCSPDSPPQSQWVQTTLSDLESKMNTMMTLLEEDGNSSAHTAMNYQKKNQELIQMLEEFNKSYRSLAEEYDQLMSKSHHVLNSGFSSSSSNPRKIQCTSSKDKRLEGSSDDPKLEAFDIHPESAVDDPNLKCDSANFDFNNKLADELVSNEPYNMNFERKLGIKHNQMDKRTTMFLDKENTTIMMNDIELGQTMVGDYAMDSYEWEDTWSELKFQVTKLMEENSQKQVELVRRNDEKRQAIKELQLQLEVLKSKNRVLENCLRGLEVDKKPNRFQISGLRRLLLGKFFRGHSA